MDQALTLNYTCQTTKIKVKTQNNILKKISGSDSAGGWLVPGQEIVCSTI